MSLTADVTPFTVKPNQPKQWLWPVVISILAHALLLLLSKQKLDIKTPSDSTEPAIQSYLYTPPAEVVPQVQPEPEEKTVSPPAMEVPAREQAPESEVQPQPESPENVDIPEETTPVTVNTEPVVTEAETEAEQNNTQTYNWSGNGLSGQLSNQLQQLQQQQYQNMLNQQTQGYTRQWDQQSVRPSPVPELSPEQALRQATQITTDCDKGLNKTLAFLSGISGGTVKCSDNGNVKKFIQQRLNKKHLLP